MAEDYNDHSNYNNDFTKQQGSMDWTADEEEEIQQSPPPTPQKRQHSDTETSSSKRQATESAPITYASVTKPTQATQANQASQLTPSQIDRHRRTLILRRLPYNTTTEDITNALRYELDTDKLNDYIDSILRDKDDRRRYYVTFNRYEDKRRIASKGFRIGDFTIPAQSGDVSGLIPYPTYYLTETDVHNLLIPYGHNITGYFRRDKDGIRTGGYNFTMDLRPGLTLPKTLTIHNETINVINKDDKRYCTYCDRHGHTRQYCRQRQHQYNTEE